MSEDSNISPFGNPDGARADLDQVRVGFIKFGNANIWGGIATEKDDFSARIIVGRKGSGKTLYLRRLQDAASQEVSMYADEPQQNLPTTTHIVKFSQWFNSQVLTEKWRELWRRAILRSLYSHICFSDSLRDRVDEKIKTKLVQDFGEILPDTTRPRSTYSQVTEIISGLNSEREFNELCDRPEWEDLEYDLSRLVSVLPPICFFLDAVDEEFAHAPMYWLRCQKGLFYQVMRFLRDAKLGARLHVFVCVRDIVLCSIFMSEHQSRYRGEPHVRILKWNKGAVRKLLEDKVTSISSHYFWKQGNEAKTVEKWLGIQSIINPQRNQTEKITDYILRHTRLLPRDIVTLGNRLCDSIVQYKSSGADDAPLDVVIAVVHQCALVFANEQLAICSNQISADTMPQMAAEFGFSELYTSDKEYTAHVSELIIECLRKLSSDTFSSEERWKIEKLFSDKLQDGGAKCSLFSVLWQNGLIGYQDHGVGGDTYIYYSEDHLDNFTLPDHMPKYSMHSILSDLLKPRRLGNCTH